MEFYFVQVVEKEFHKVIAPYKKLPYSASCIIPCSQAPFCDDKIFQAFTFQFPA